MRLLRGKQVYGPNSITGKSRASVYRDIKTGTFPAPVLIGPRAVAWRSTDIDDWVVTRQARSAAA